MSPTVSRKAVKSETSLDAAANWKSIPRPTSLHYATNRKVAGSDPGSLIGIFHWYNPSGCTMAKGRIRLSRKCFPRIFTGGERRPACMPLVLKSGKLKFLETLGTVQVYTGIILPFLCQMWLTHEENRIEGQSLWVQELSLSNLGSYWLSWLPFSLRYVAK